MTDVRSNEWLLALAAPDEALPPDKAPVTLDMVRELAQSESEGQLRAVKLLSRLTDDGAWLPLHFSAIQVMKCCEACAAETHFLSPQSLQGVFDLHAAVKQWLSNFRSFDDHTSSWLSSTFGPDSKPYGSFKDQLSTEYDNNFAYRFCSTLRNQSEHVGRVLNVLGGRPEFPPAPFFGFDGPKLGETFPDLKAATRKELAALKHPLRLQRVVSAVMDSCTIAHHRMWLTLEEQIRAAADQIQDLENEAASAGGLAGFIGDRPPPNNSGSISFREVGVRFASLAYRGLDAARRSADVGGVKCDAADLV